jgi:hypothetical protein
MRRVVAAGFAMSAVTALAVAAQPASAATHRPCTIVKHSTTTGVTKVGTATATVVADGIKLTTAPSANNDKVSWTTRMGRSYGPAHSHAQREPR